MSMPRRKRRQCTIIREAGKWQQYLPQYRKHIRQWVELALADAPAGAVAVVLTDDAHMQALNAQFRGKDRSTNVLSFSGDGDEVGDVVLALEIIVEEAQAQQKIFMHHLAHLVMHGCLHLCGYDHENARDRSIMEAKEIALLERLDIANPYIVASAAKSRYT